MKKRDKTQLLSQGCILFGMTAFLGRSLQAFAYFTGSQLLSDPTATQGMNVSPACNHPDTDPRCGAGATYYLENPFFGPSKALCKLAQWHSQSDLPTDYHCGTYDGYGCLWANDDKRVVFYEDGRIELAMNGDHEFGGVFPPDSTGPGLLFGQPIGELGGGSPALPLDQVTELRWDLDVRLTYMDNSKKKACGKCPNNGAIIPLYLTVQNLIPGDPDFHKYIWLGIGLYDDREPFPKDYLAEDPGTHELIYNPAFSNFSSVSVQSGDWVHVAGDMMPYLRYAVQQAVARGYFQSGDLSKLKIGGMSIGWELSAPYSTTMQFKNLSLRQFTAQNPKPYEFDRDGDREGWLLIHSMGEWTAGPSGGVWILAPQVADPQFLSPLLEVDTSVVKKIVIRMANDAQPDGNFQLFWAADAAGSFTENSSQSFTMPTDGGWREYTIDLSSHPKWKGTVRRIRIDPVRTGNGSGFGIDYIRFSH